MKSLNLSIFIVNNLYYVIICLNINRVTIYRAKCFSILALKVLPTTCFRYNSKEISSKFPIRKWSFKQNRYEFPSANFMIKCLEDSEKMAGVHKSFFHFSRKVDTFISILHTVFLRSYYLMVWWWLQMKGRLLAKKEIQGDIRSNIAYIVHIWNISNIACYKKSLKFNLLFISKFKFDRVHGKMLNDTHLKVI